ncbi:MAG: Lysyl-lysine 2,3-aminomutase [Fibrobacteres bacterium]|nr:Lysyl-lysine 2,3-aminomutase [Fibrobacterota bacterium]
MPILPKTSVTARSGLLDHAGRPETAGTTSREPVRWQKEMQDAFRTGESLLRFLDLDPAQAPEGLAPDPAFPVLVPQSFASRMVKGDWRDPLLLQVLPRDGETRSVPGFLADAVGDLASQVVPGLLHKYDSRALLMVSHQCAVHCRYCFRREFPYGDMPRGQAGWDEAWAYLESAEGVDEIVLSGGDPLFLDNRRLERILERAAALPRLRTVRFHTRLPIVLPSRIEPGLLAMLRSLSEAKTLIVVIHANHANELDAGTGRALSGLRAAGAMLLNQAVLMAGINDDADVLADLSRGLLAQGVLPYYLHQLDRVVGTAHFETPEAKGRDLIEALRGKLPGYAVPRYVRETAGEPFKTPLSV